MIWTTHSLDMHLAFWSWLGGMAVWMCSVCRCFTWDENQSVANLCVTMIHTMAKTIHTDLPLVNLLALPKKMSAT